MIIERFPGLDELAFEGRNKAYGAYDLRKRYIRRLSIAAIIGVLILLIVVMANWAVYYFDPVTAGPEELFYAMDYYSMSPPPEDATDQMVQAFAKQEEVVQQAPVVTDSVKKEEKPPEEVKPEEKPEAVKANIDSAASAGGSGLGTGVGDDTGIASSIDVYPRYPGGDDARLYYLRTHVRYPEAALKEFIQGVVMVVFVVELDGSLTHIDVTNKLGGGCDEEAIRVTREMPKWEPGKRKGRAVRVMVRMPIVFRMPGKTLRKQ